jgi:hypothetical protein
VAITQRITETCLFRRWPGHHLQAWLIDLQIDSIGKARNGKEEANVPTKKYDEQIQSAETAGVEKEEERDSDRSMLHAYCSYPEMVIGVASQVVKVCLISRCSHPTEARMAHC